MSNIFPNFSTLSNFEYDIQFNNEEWYIISVQHLLESTGSLFEKIIATGFSPQHIFLTGKLYSTHRQTQDKLKQLGINIVDSSVPSELGYYAEHLQKDVASMWNMLSGSLEPQSKIIILDDGGYALKCIPLEIMRKYQIYGIEQTTSGIRMVKEFGNFPVIRLAASAAKTIIEPPIISEAVSLRVGNIISQLHPKKIGIVGYGHIGKAIAERLGKQYDLVIYDIKNELKELSVGRIAYVDSIESLYNTSDIIIGATGQDISEMSWLSASTGDKTLISVSSGDVEFNTILRQCKPYLTELFSDPLQVLNIKTGKGHLLKIVRGAMVANFTGAADSSPGPIIQVTRCLLFAAVIQILRDNKKLKTIHKPIMLDPYFQSEIVQLWFNNQPQRKTDYSEEILNGFQNIEWIKERSTGEFIDELYS